MLSNIRFYTENQYRRYHNSYRSCRVPLIKEKEGGIRDRAGFYIIIINNVDDNVSDNIKK